MMKHSDEFKQEAVLIGLDRKADFLTAESKRHGARNARQERDIVDFLDNATNFEPVLDIPANQIDDADRALRPDTFGIQPLVEGQAFERSAIAWAREANHSVIARESKPAGKARQEAQRLKRTSVHINPAKFDGSRLQHPKLLAVEPRGMRH